MKPAIAFIGLGIMGHRMLANMTAHGGFTFVGGWDPSSAARKKTRASFPDLVLCDSPEEIIRNTRADVVYIACPPAAHKEHAMAAIAAGKALFCEKPLGVDVEDSKVLVRDVERAGLPNAVNFPFADLQAVNKIDHDLRSGLVGDVIGADVRLHFSQWPRDWQESADWLAKRAQGGFVREVFSHFAYLTQRLFGPPELRQASVLYPADTDSCETQFLARLDCRGIPISVAGGSGGVGPDQIEFTVWGSKTSYRLWDWNKLMSTTGGPWREELADLQNPRQDGYRRMLDNFLAFVAGKPHTMPTFRDALAVQEIVERILRS